MYDKILYFSQVFCYRVAKLLSAIFLSIQTIQLFLDKFKYFEEKSKLTVTVRI